MTAINYPQHMGDFGTTSGGLRTAGGMIPKEYLPDYLEACLEIEPKPPDMWKFTHSGALSEMTWSGGLASWGTSVTDVSNSITISDGTAT